jgi:predicted NUDIX family NTP pyrophosphohydrolase
MPKKSAGIALYRKAGESVEVFLVHFGGPMWAKKDDGAWSFPKGEYDDTEDPLDAALREFQEETGQSIDGDFISLEPVKQKSGKTIHLWAVEGDVDASAIRSGTFSMEWPPRSGRRADFPEVDRAGWFSAEEARRKLVKGQVPFVDQLCARL